MRSAQVGDWVMTKHAQVGDWEMTKHARVGNREGYGDAVRMG